MVRNPQRVVASWLREPVPSGWSSATRGTCATGGRDPPGAGLSPCMHLLGPDGFLRRGTPRIDCKAPGRPARRMGGPLGGPANSNAQWRGAANALKAGAAHAGPGCIGPAEPRLLPSRAGRRRWRVRQLCRGRTRRVSSEASAARPRSRTAASGIATSAGELPATSGAARATARAARHRRNQRQMRTRAMAMRNLRCSHLSSNRRCFAQRRLSSRRRGAGATTRRRPSLSVTTRPLVLAPNEANSMPATRPELKPARRSSLTTWRSPARASALRLSSTSSRASRRATALVGRENPSTIITVSSDTTAGRIRMTRVVVMPTIQ